MTTTPFEFGQILALAFCSGILVSFFALGVTRPKKEKPLSTAVRPLRLAPAIVGWLSIVAPADSEVYLVVPAGETWEIRKGNP